MRRNPTLLRAVDGPPELYFRAGHSDHRAVERTLASGMPPFSGVVFDASRTKRQAELRTEVRRRGLDAVLDSMALELATPGGWEREGLRALPWAGAEADNPERFDTNASRRLVERVVEFALKNKYSAIIAPTHFLQDGVQDPWWVRDQETFIHLARAVREIDGANRPRIYYRLAASRKILADPDQRAEMLRVLADLPKDALWLCVHRVGASSGPIAARSYADICSDLSSTKGPLIAERTGGLGTVMLAFGVVDGIESGITSGENFDASRLLRPPLARDDEAPHAIAARVYIQRLGIFLKRKEAEIFFGRHGMKGRFGCQGRDCCREIDDMIDDPLRHFLVTRAEEVEKLTQVPRHDRATVYMERVLRRASDDAVALARVDPKKFEPIAERLRGWRLVFGRLLEERTAEAAQRTKADVIPLRGR